VPEHTTDTQNIHLFAPVREHLSEILVNIGPPFARVDNVCDFSSIGASCIGHLNGTRQVIAGW
jgi:hypothetical protein